MKNFYSYLRAMLALLFLASGIGTAWGDDTVTYAASDFSGGTSGAAGAQMTVSQHNPFTLTASGYKKASNSYVQIYAEDVITITGNATVTAITQIDFEHYGTKFGTFTIQGEGVTGTVTMATSSGGTSTIKNITAGTQTISIKNTATGQAQLKNIKIYYTKATGTVSVTNVAVSPTTLALTVGETQSLTATVSPDNATNKNVTWESDNESVAAVSDTGTVTAAAAGTATITATTEDGNFTNSCNVTVSAASATTGETVSIVTSDFTTSSYADNNGNHTKKSSENRDFVFYTNQVYQNSSLMQWQKDKGYIYNKTSLGQIDKIEITLSGGSLTVYEGTAENCSSGTVIYGTGSGTITYPFSGSTDFFYIKAGSATTKTSEIKIYFKAQTPSAPVFTTHPQSATYDQNAAAVALTVAATGYPTPTYQWYQNTANSVEGASPIENATGTSYTPSTAEVGTKYYFCKATNSEASSGVASEIAAITVNAVQYTLTYDINGGTGAVSAATADAGSNVTLAAGTGLSKDGYVFAGWNTKADGTGLHYAAGAAFTLTESTTLYAQWDKGDTSTTYTITFATGTTETDNIVTSTSPSSVIRTGASYVSGFTTNDYAYYATMEGLKLGVADAQGVLTMSLNEAGQKNASTIVVRAKMYNISNTATLQVNGAEAQELATEWADYEFDVRGVIESITLTSSKYCFISSVTVNYGPKKYTVLYDANGGEGTMTDAGSPYDENTTVSVLANTFTRAGHTFRCWNTEANGSGTSYSAGDTFQIGANTTLYAQWDASLIAVTWLVNGNAAQGTPTTGVTYGERVTTLPTAPESSDFDGIRVFVGWSNTEVEDGNAPGVLFTDASASPIITEPTTFYAVFAAKSGTAAISTSTAKKKDELMGVFSGYGITDYADSHAPYQIKLDNTGDYIQAEAGDGKHFTSATINWKMLGGNNTSTITLQGSMDGTEFSDIDEYEVSGAGNSEGTATKESGLWNYKAIRWLFTKGSNIGVYVSVSIDPNTYSNYATSYDPSSQPATCVITWKVNGTVVATEEKTQGSAIVLPETPENIDEYVFVGWTSDDAVTDENYTKIVEGSAVPSSPATTFQAVFALRTETNGDEVEDSHSSSSMNSQWTASGLGGNYSSVPKFRMDSTDDYIQSATYNGNITYVTFRWKGNGTSGNSYLEVIGIKDGAETVIETLNTIPTNETLKKINVSGSYNSVKFKYTKDGGNVAIDNFTVRYCETTVTYTNYTTSPVSRSAVHTFAFSPTAITVKVGQTGVTLPTLTATTDGTTQIAAADISYESRNTDVADFVDGTLTFKAAGTAEIVASFAGNSQYKPATASYTVTVEKLNVTAAWSCESAEVFIDGELPTLTATDDLGNDATGVVYYLSNDTKVVKWNNTDKRLEIVGVGTATLTATLNNSATDSYNTFEATCEVTVKLHQPYLFAWSSTDDVDFFLDETYTLPTLNAKYDEGTDIPMEKIIFTSTSESVATVDANGVITINSDNYAGQTTIKAKLDDPVYESVETSFMIITKRHRCTTFKFVDTNNIAVTEVTAELNDDAPALPTLRNEPGYEVTYTVEGDEALVTITDGVVVALNTAQAGVATIKAEGHKIGYYDVTAEYTFRVVDPNAPLEVVFDFTTKDYGITVATSSSSNDYETVGKTISEGVAFMDIVSTRYRIWDGAGTPRDLRFFNKGSDSWTIRVADGYVITSIEYEGSAVTGIRYDGNALTNMTWEGNQQSVQFTQDSNSKIQKITVKYRKSKMDPCLSFALPTYIVYEDEYFEVPTPVSLSDGAITYASDNEDVAMVENTGEGFSGVAGEATITATQAETDDYASATASFLLKVVPQTISVTTNSLGWATYAPEYDVMLPEQEGADVYYISADEDGKTVVKTSSVADALDADCAMAKGTGVLVKTDKPNTTVDFPCSLITDGSKIKDAAKLGNLLVGVLKPTNMEGIENAYIFTKKTIDDKDRVGFYICTGGTLAAGKCYLHLTPAMAASAPRFITLFDDDTATCIEAVGSDEEEPMYDLTGRRVTGDYKGVVIVNGKKVMRK